MSFKRIFLIGFIVFCAPYVFWFYLGGDSYVLIHDTLDSEFVYIKKILEKNIVFNLNFKEEISGVMNGLPRTLLRSGFNITVLIFAMLSPIKAYILNHFLVHFIGYIGMFILLREFFIKENKLLVLVISLSFGFLSYYHIQYGISISGQPLLLYAFLCLLYRRQRWYHWLIIILFPFFSFIVVTLPFFIPFLVAFGLWSLKAKKIFPKSFFLGILILFLLNILIENQLVYATFISESIISHRIEADNFKLSGLPSWSKFYNTIKLYLTSTQYHTGSLDVRPIVLSFLVFFLIKRYRLSMEIRYVSSIIVLIIFWVAINFGLMYVLRPFEFLRTFNSERFYFLLPFLWLLLFALLIQKAMKSGAVIKTISFAMLVIVGYSIIERNKEFINNGRIVFGMALNEPNFDDFFATDLFDEIKSSIKMDLSSNFISVGIYPSIAQYNGLSTLDSYQNNYELSYKHEFREIISDELSKNIGNQNYFDYWGSRCYYFSSEIGRRYVIPKDSKYVIKNMAINTNQFKEMNGKYLLSSVPIANFDGIGFNFINEFSSSNSFWKLYLYELK